MFVGLVSGCCYQHSASSPAPVSWLAASKRQVVTACPTKCQEMETGSVQVGSLMSVSRNPAEVMLASICRFGLQPASPRNKGASRSCHRATAGSGALPCSKNRRRPSGRSTRRISPRAALRSGMEHSVQVLTTVSTLPESRGMLSARRRVVRLGKAPIARPLRPACGERRGFEAEDAGHFTTIVGQVESGADADFQHTSRRQCRDSGAMAADRLVLHSRRNHAGHDPVRVKAHPEFRRWIAPTTSCRKSCSSRRPSMSLASTV